MSEQKREKVIRFRVSDEEEKAIQNAFEKSGCTTLSDYLRTISMYCCIFEIDEKELAAIRRAISSVANNINQITIRVNSTGNVYQEDMQGIRNGVEKLWQQQAFILSLPRRQEP